MTPGTARTAQTRTARAARKTTIRFNGARAGVDPAVFDYVSPVPLFASGAEAAEHGKRDLPHPGPEARRKTRQLLRLQGARNRRIALPGDETAAVKAGEDQAT